MRRQSKSNYGTESWNNCCSTKIFAQTTRRTGRTIHLAREVQQNVGELPLIISYFQLTHNNINHWGFSSARLANHSRRYLNFISVIVTIVKSMPPAQRNLLNSGNHLLVLHRRERKES
ncbi:hypothetical protein RSAG8_07842, partial [Rhizoctonia solani AG-8 WAC10335]